MIDIFTLFRVPFQSVLLGLYVLAFSGPVFSDVLPVNDSFAKDIYISNLKMLKDSTLELDAREVSVEFSKGRFQYRDKMNRFLKGEETHYWFLFDITLRLSEGESVSTKKILTTEGMGSTDYSLYELIDNEVIERKKINEWSHTVDLEPNRKHTYLMGLKSSGMAKELKIELWGVAEYLEHQTVKQHLLSLYFGLALAMFLFNGALYLMTREVLHLYYSLCIISLILVVAAMTSFGVQHVWTAQHGFNDYVLSFFGLGAMSFNIYFSRHYFNLSAYSENMNIAHLWVAHTNLVIALMYCLPFGVVIETFIYLWSVFMLLYLICTAIYLWIKGNHNAGIYILSFSGLVFGAIYLNFVMIGFFSNGMLAFIAVPLGSAIQMLTLSIALADEIKRRRQEKETSQYDLIVMLKEAFGAQRDREYVLNNSKTKYQTLYETNLDGLFQCDMSGKVKEANRAFKTMFDIQEKGSISGLDLYLFQDLVDGNGENLVPAVGEEYLNREVRLKKTGAIASWGSMSLHRVDVIDKEGYIEGAIRNITERKEKEEIELEMQVVEDSTRAKSAFLANMSHVLMTV